MNFVGLAQRAGGGRRPTGFYVRIERDEREAEVRVRQQQRHHTDQFHDAVRQLRKGASAPLEAARFLFATRIGIDFGRFAVEIPR